ncbi:hypothetical protein, partial [Polymorphobacter sp.]|uniref:hypothetical protein n=1 Tax=Polymorphobacter sp. TaxID=1909290 RepID=UPI003F717C29
MRTLLGFRLFAIILFAFITHSSATAATTYFATESSFAAILKQLVAGDTVKLQGTFTKSIDIKDKYYRAPVTIDASAATITQGMKLISTHGINVTGGQWLHDPARVQSVTIRDSSNISFANTSFTGPATNSTGRAIYVVGSS